MIRTFLYLELLRASRNRRFWFWALFGGPVLIPGLVVGLAVALAWTGSVKPENARPAVALSGAPPAVLEALSDAGVVWQSYPDRDDVIEAVREGAFPVGLVDTAERRGEPLRATLVSAGHEKVGVHRDVVSALEVLAGQHQLQAVEALEADPASKEMILSPLLLTERTLRHGGPSGLAQLAMIVWFGVVVFPYVLLSMSGGDRILTDRLSGYLTLINASCTAPWRWLVARWLTLGVIALALVVCAVGFLSAYLWAFGALSDVLVAKGVLGDLSTPAAADAKAFLVDAVAMWRGTGWGAWMLWLGMAAVQLAAVVAMTIWASAKANAMANFRFLELLPTVLVVVVPMLGLGALGAEGPAAGWIPGLNTLLTFDNVVSGDWGELASALRQSLVSNGAFAVLFVLLGALALRDERLWSI